ncbi:MAG: sulfatase-like hydrolase/transferase [Bacteroidetes bacterium]|nr:sulfatase-like hydrolase/transferase [Bacteroidota bacterium]
METKEGGWEFRPGPMVQDWDPYQVLPTLMEKAVEWIENQDGEKPFFLYFPFPSPHAPIIPGDEFDGKTDAGAYGDFVFQTDYVAGQVLEALERKGFTDETLVIFTADNGPEHYAYPRIQNYGHYSMGPLRGLKRDIYEGGHRVPFLIKWPGIIDAGQVSTELIHQVDILATLAHLIGFVLSDSVGIDSYNQLPLLLGESTDPVRTSAVHNTRADGFAFRKNNWLFLDRYTGHNTRVPNWFLEEHGYDYIDKEIPGQLFDLRIDTAQKMNLYIKYPELVEKMKLELELEKNRKHSVR